MQKTLRVLKSTRLARLCRLCLKSKEINILDLIRLNYTARYISFSIKLNGKPFVVSDSQSFLGTYKEIFLDKIYLFDSNSKTPVIIDAGANMGLGPIFWSLHWPDAKMTCFEPDRKIFLLLENNIREQGIRNCTPINKAISSVSGPRSFRSEGGTSGRLSDSLEPSTIECVGLGTFLGCPVDLLKIDIEGEEVDVLLECKDLLCNVKNLFVEYHSFSGKPQRLDELLSCLSLAGFRYYIHTEFCGKRPFCETPLNDDMDLQLNIFCVRVGCF